MGVVNRWREYARQYGWGGLAAYLGARLLRPVWEAASAEILVLEGPVPERPARVPLEIRVLAPAEGPGTGLMHPDWAQRWSRGDICYGAWVDGVFVHHSWVTRHDALIGEVHGHLTVAPDEAYIYDCYTAGDRRGQGIFPAVLTHIGRTLMAEGVVRVWIAVEHTNRSSIKAIERAGFRLTGSIRYRRVFGSATCVSEIEPFKFGAGA